MLLDEVAAHLDRCAAPRTPGRLAGGGGQAWLTGTEAGLFDAMPGPVTRFQVAGGPDRAGLGRRAATNCAFPCFARLCGPSFVRNAEADLGRPDGYGSNARDE